MNTIQELENIFNANKDKKICVIGTTCIGKSTLLKHLPECYDMDEILFPLLTNEETKTVCATPWTKEIGEYMNKLAKEKIKIACGHPVFGTVLLDAELIVLLTIDSELLKERTRLRDASFESSLKMQEEIVTEVKASKIPYIIVNIK